MSSEIKNVLGNWDIGDVKAIKELKKGEVNKNWLLNCFDGKKYILRRVRTDKNKEQLEFELDYLNSLKESGFDYEIPVPTLSKNGESFVEVGGYCFWVYKFIEGNYLAQLGKGELREVAKMMARYHDIVEKIGLKNNAINLDDMVKGIVIKELREFISKINKGEIKTQDNKIFLRESKILIGILNKIDTKRYEKLKKYPIHRDLNPENLLWKGKKLIGVLDFDNVSQINERRVLRISLYPCLV